MVGSREWNVPETSKWGMDDHSTRTPPHGMGGKCAGGLSGIPNSFSFNHLKLLFSWSRQLVFDYFCERTPRSYVEARETSLVWNYKFAGFTGDSKY